MTENKSSLFYFLHYKINYATFKESKNVMNKLKSLQKSQLEEIFGQKDYKTKEKELEAYHLAANALTALLFRIKFDQISIERKEVEVNIHPIVKINNGISFNKNIISKMKFEDRLCLLYSGVLAEEKKFKIEGYKNYCDKFGLMWYAYSNDFDSLVISITTDEKETKYFMNWIKYRTNKIIEDLWKEIERVAGYLMENKVLTYKQVKELVSEELINNLNNDDHFIFFI